MNEQRREFVTLCLGANNDAVRPWKARLLATKATYRRRKLSRSRNREDRARRISRRGAYHGMPAWLLTSSWAEGASEPERFLIAGDKLSSWFTPAWRPKGSSAWSETRLADVFTFRHDRPVQLDSLVCGRHRGNFHPTRHRHRVDPAVFCRRDRRCTAPVPLLNVIERERGDVGNA
jgi:hypothetical protein